MVNRRVNPVVVLSTGQLWQFDMAVDTLKQARIPHFAEEETIGGLRLAMPIAPALGPGVFWTLRVPELDVDKAKLVLAELPFESKTNPDAWDFKPRQSAKKFWKTWIIACLIIEVIICLVGLLR